MGVRPGTSVEDLNLTGGDGPCSWDLATATGQPIPFPDDLAERGLSVARRQLGNRPAGDHSPFGAEMDVSP